MTKKFCDFCGKSITGPEFTSIKVDVGMRPKESNGTDVRYWITIGVFQEKAVNKVSEEYDICNDCKETAIERAIRCYRAAPAEAPYSAMGKKEAPT